MKAKHRKKFLKLNSPKPSQVVSLMIDGVLYMQHDEGDEMLKVCPSRSLGYQHEIIKESHALYKLTYVEWDELLGERDFWCVVWMAGAKQLGQSFEIIKGFESGKYIGEHGKWDYAYPVSDDFLEELAEFRKV